MALQTSGAISLNEIHIEAGGSSGTTASLNDTDIRALISKSSGAQSSFSEFYGASASYELTLSSNQSNANLRTLAVNDGWDESTYIEIIVPSGSYIYHGCTISGSWPGGMKLINNGKIYGRGAGGRAGWIGPGTAGSPAITLSSTGVTIQNNSGAFIAGGGGGGVGGNSSGSGGGGGGGAGESTPGQVGWSNPYNGAPGGAAGGGSGGYAVNWGAGGFWAGWGGGGGGILDTDPSICYGGGSGGHTNQNASTGGGGGYGANGGSYGGYTGGSGGAAISASVSYTLSNSGTIWGTT